jgi:hypothetical protein
VNERPKFPRLPISTLMCGVCDCEKSRGAAKTEGARTLRYHSSHVGHACFVRAPCDGADIARVRADLVKSPRAACSRLRLDWAVDDVVGRTRRQDCSRGSGLSNLAYYERNKGRESEHNEGVQLGSRAPVVW